MFSDKPLQHILGEKIEDIALRLEGTSFEDLPNRTEKIGYAGIGYGIAADNYPLMFGSGVVAATSNLVNERIKVEKKSASYEDFEEKLGDLGENLGESIYGQEENIIKLEDDQYEFHD